MKLLFKEENEFVEETNKETELKQIHPRRGWIYQQERFIKQARKEREEANQSEDNLDG